MTDTPLRLRNCPREEALWNPGLDPRTGKGHWRQTTVLLTVMYQCQLIALDNYYDYYVRGEY